MIGTLRGRLLSKRPTEIIVDVQGVGYEVFVPGSAISGLPEQGVDVFLHIHTHVKEDSIRLYGFPSQHEKQVFATLLNVNGVGPRLALNILSSLPGDSFRQAVESEDTAALSKVPGIGKKTAARIILELRQKLPSITEGQKDAVFEDALSALVNLGYKKAEAQRALEKTGKDKKVKKDEDEKEGIEELLKGALKELTGH
ncbi:MAG: Holliday junction branch migration protein RuvA [Nitrospiraceae bacterium]|nr:Holliday junction branch migration protein RuvA [Nitrospiraceae bacterium]